MFADFVDGNNVRMLKGGGHFGLGAKALDEFIAGEFSKRKHFDRDHAIQAYLTGAVDNPHAAAGDFLQQLVIAKAI